MGEGGEKGRGGAGVYGTPLFYNFSDIAIASETRVIIGQELKVWGWPAIAVEFTSQMDMIAS